MQQSTKQRIVGTIVLLALALIFLPIVFDGQGSYQSPITSRIPEPPEIVIMPEPAQTRPVIVADSLPEAEDTQTAEEPAASENEEESAVGGDVDAEIATEEAAGEDPLNPAETVAVTTSQPVYEREPPPLGADGLPQGWSVRLGSFADSSNANNLLQRLQDAGYRAYTRAIVAEQGDLTGVFVGPWLDRSAVANYQQELQERFQLAGIVVRYEIEDL